MKKTKLISKLQDVYAHLFKKYHFIYDGQSIAYAADIPDMPSGTVSAIRLCFTD